MTARGRQLILLRRAHHFASIVTPIAVVLVVSCASARAEQTVEKPAEANANTEERERTQRETEALALLKQIAAETAKNAAANQPTTQPQDPYQWIEAGSAIVQALAALAIVGFTWWLAQLNKGLLRATQDTATAAKDSAKAAQDNAQAAIDSVDVARTDMYLRLRARLGLSAIQAHHFDGPGKEILLSIEFKNFGGKGAMIQTACVVLSVAKPLAPQPTYPKNLFMDVGVPVEAGHSHFLTITLTHFTAEEWSAITDENGVDRFIIYGVVNYLAGLGKDANMGFCRFYDPALSRLTGIPMFPTMNAKGYNYAE